MEEQGTKVLLMNLFFCLRFIYFCILFVYTKSPFFLYYILYILSKIKYVPCIGAVENCVDGSVFQSTNIKKNAAPSNTQANFFLEWPKDIGWG